MQLRLNPSYNHYKDLPVVKISHIKQKKIPTVFIFVDLQISWYFFLKSENEYP